MSKQREEFEAWAEPQGVLLGRLVSDERYESMTTELAFRAWQASRAAALESVEALLEDKRREAWGQTEVEWAFGDALEAVELLKEQS